MRTVQQTMTTFQHPLWRELLLLVAVVGLLVLATFLIT
jgi:hypothetical protein